MSGAAIEQIDYMPHERKWSSLPDPDNGPDDFELPSDISDERRRKVEFYRNALIDALTIVPVDYEDERLKFAQARVLILEQLAQAHAPYSDREVACLIETGDPVTKFVGGHNYEHTDGNFEHAEPSALSKFTEHFPGSKIKRLFMIGYGQDREKKICPCQDCYAALSPHLSDSSDIVLFNPVDFRQATVLTPQEYRPAYEAKEYCAIESGTIDDIISELQEKTVLSEDDARLIAQIRLAGLETGISFFLSGSASGRGWISNAIHSAQGMERQYNDLDIIAVSPEPEIVAGVIEKILARNFGNYSKEVTIHHIQGRTTTRSGTKYINDGMPPLEVQVASHLQEGMSRPDYYEKNFFIELS